MMRHLVSFQASSDICVCDDSLVKYCYIIIKIKMGRGYLQEDTEPICQLLRAERSGVCFETSLWT